MSNAWEKAKDQAEQHSKNTLFVRLANDGDKVVGVFVGEPYPREVVWSGDTYVDADSSDGQALLTEGRKPSFRAAMNIYVPAEKSMKVIEMGVVMFKDLIKLRDKYGLENWDFEVQRHGASGDQKTTYSVLPEHQLTDSEKKEIAKIEPHDLASILRENDASDENKSSSAFIGADVVSKLMPRLKALPREVLDQFLSKFQIKRVKDLHAQDEAAAWSWLDQIESKGRQGEVDPFA